MQASLGKAGRYTTGNIMDMNKDLFSSNAPVLDNIFMLMCRLICRLVVICIVTVYFIILTSYLLLFIKLKYCYEHYTMSLFWEISKIHDTMNLCNIFMFSSLNNHTSI